MLSAGCRDPSRTNYGPPADFIRDERRAQGFDVSQAQGEVPWRTLAQSELDFVFIRASEGVSIKDRFFKHNWAMAKACQIPRGAYHVFQPGDSVEEQLENFLPLMGGDYGELPPVLDVEIPKKWVKRFPSPASYSAALVEMSEKIYEKTGWAPMIYIQPWYWEDYLDRSRDVTKYHLWAAGTVPRAHEDWAWTFWQHGHHTHWANRQWDHDIYRGSAEELHAFSQSKGALGLPEAR